MLPEFAQAGSFPTAAGLGEGRGRTDQEREVTARVSGDRFAVALESEAGDEFVGNELIVGRALERQEGGQELLDLGGPCAAVVAAGEVESESVWFAKPGGTQAKEMSPADAQELGGGVRVEIAAVEAGERLMEELQGEAFGKLVFCKRPFNPRARPQGDAFRQPPLRSGLLTASPCGRKMPTLRGRVISQSHFVPPGSLILFPPQHVIKNLEAKSWQLSNSCKQRDRT